jgi:two-component system, sensor histidine kinase PdtaS
MTAQTLSGLDVVGPLPWGAHLCQLYDKADDLAEFLVPYFKAGLEANENCLWISCDPMPAQACEAVLRNAVPDLDQRIAKGQIEILNHEEWYLRFGDMTARDVIDGWLGREARALDAGYAGLRLTGNTYWLEPKGWRDFQEYEATLNGCFHGHRIVALCSYCMSRCDAAGMLDIVENHQFAVARRHGEWSIVESASHKAAKAELQRLNEELEFRVTDRTRHLTQALSDREALLHEVHHRVRNNLQVVISLLRAKRRQLSDGPARLAFDDAVNRVYSISLVHDELHKGDRFGVVDVGSYLSRLCDHLLDVTGAARSVRIDIDASGIGLGAGAAVPVGLVVNELVWNACKHAFPAGHPGCIRVSLTAEGDDYELRVEDDGIGMRESSSDERPAGAGVGMAIATRIAAQLGGTLSVEPARPSGTLVRLRFPGQ